ncbi:MAG: TolC family protein [Myxococcota bacterium]
MPKHVSYVICAIVLLATGCAAPIARDVPESMESFQDQPGEDELPEFDGALEPYVDYALRHHPDLKADVARWRAERARIDAAYSWPEPTISYGLFIRPVETRVGPQRHRFGLSQPIPWPNKPAKAARAQAKRADASKARYDAAMLVVRAQVTEKYWRQWQTGRQLYWKRQQLTLLETVEAVTRARVEVGKSPQSDLNQIALELTRLRDDIEKLQNVLERQQARFVDALGRRDAGELPVEPADLPSAHLPSASPEELAKLAESHPQLVAMQRTIESLERTAERRQLDRYPDMTVGVDYIETGEAQNPDLPDSGKDPVIAMVGVKIPIWVGRYQAQVDATHAEAESKRADLEAARNRAVSNVRAAVARLRDSARRIHLYETTLIPQSEVTYESVLGRYEVDQTTIASVLLAQRELLRVRLGLANARAEHATDWVRLEQLVGEPIDAAPYHARGDDNE